MAGTSLTYVLVVGGAKARKFTALGLGDDPLLLFLIEDAGVRNTEALRNGVDHVLRNRHGVMPVAAFAGTAAVLALGAPQALAVLEMRLYVLIGPERKGAVRTLVIELADRAVQNLRGAVELAAHLMRELADVQRAGRKSPGRDLISRRAGEHHRWIAHFDQKVLGR